ncbi:sugar ABC transporter substrate-binding protein [Nocardioides ganghwensis]|jgi:ribose transport system substrate-binding protein|uniref:LacI family transcriptional regulator n=1 Tax=Nocardioides ganghwensis TaxID=252230 RepID=A0A4Q2SES7_9ACTN|nr:sugar ABC transporter substrate-binding protein [Nocardioides ganghwensis]MBD3946521.1 sugar ABC transporter substrate-binding protein [Nocardioides ganghwensis]RYC03261.1 LacI family transcriptional regulator [Nocardioides ganghwensis]
MRSTRTAAAVMTLLFAASALSACGSDSASSASGDGTKVYALLPQGTDQPYGTEYLKAMNAEAEKEGLDLTITNSQYDADKQASDCQVAVAAKPDLIILWPAVADTVRPCLERAKAAGIPVTVTNSDVKEEDKSLTAGYSGPDTYGQGAASAEIMCELADGKDINILQVEGLTGNTTAINRKAGFEETIDENCPNVKIIASQPGDWNKDDSQTVTSEMLTAAGAKNIQGIYAADDTMVAGAIDALKSQGLDVKKMLITSIGNTKLGNPLVVNGELDGTVFQSSAWDGQNAVTLAAKVLDGEEVDEDLFMPSVKVTEANASDAEVTPNW